MCACGPSQGIWLLGWSIQMVDIIDFVYVLWYRIHYGQYQVSQK